MNRNRVRRKDEIFKPGSKKYLPQNMNRIPVNLNIMFFTGGYKIKGGSEIKGILSLFFGLISIFLSLSFWSGIGSLFFTSFAIPFALAGIILARSRLKKGPDTAAKAGLTASVFGFLLNIASFIMFLVYFG